MLTLLLIFYLFYLVSFRSSSALKSTLPEVVNLVGINVYNHIFFFGPLYNHILNVFATFLGLSCPLVGSYLFRYSFGK